MKTQFNKGDKVTYQVELAFGKGTHEVVASVVAIRRKNFHIEYYLDNGNIVSVLDLSNNNQ